MVVAWSGVVTTPAAALLSPVSMEHTAIQHSALAGATVTLGKGSNRNGATQSTSTSTKLTQVLHQVQRLLPAFCPTPEQQSLQFPARKPHLVCSTQASDSDEAAVTQKGLRFHKAAKNADNPSWAPTTRRMNRALRWQSAQECGCHSTNAARSTATACAGFSSPSWATQSWQQGHAPGVMLLPVPCCATVQTPCR